MNMRYDQILHQGKYTNGKNKHRESVRDFSLKRKIKSTPLISMPRSKHCQRSGTLLHSGEAAWRTFEFLSNLVSSLGVYFSDMKIDIYTKPENECLWKLYSNSQKVGATQHLSRGEWRMVIPPTNGNTATQEKTVQSQREMSYEMTKSMDESSTIMKPVCQNYSLCDFNSATLHKRQNHNTSVQHLLGAQGMGKTK